MENLIGRSADRYQIVEQIGAGGMAVVCKARDARLDRLVAKKIIRKGRIRADDLAELLERFDREARAPARLSHPNVVKIHDYGKFNGAPNFVMEYLATVGLGSPACMGCAGGAPYFPLAASANCDGKGMVTR